MSNLFDRRYELNAGGILIRDLDIVFKATKTLKKAPNTAEITIYNLNAEHREGLAGEKNLVAQLSAGYKDDIGVIFLGDVRDVESDLEPPDWLTSMETGDGERATQIARINRSFAKGTSLPIVLKEVAKSMGLQLGNLNQMAARGELVDGGQEFLNGVTLSGQSSREMERIVRSAGLEWSIQDQTLQLLEAGKTLLDTSVVLTPATGLIGSPTIGNKGVISIRALMNSDIVPGRQIELESRVISGRLRAETCVYSGDTAGQDWYVDIEAKEL